MRSTRPSVVAVISMVSSGTRVPRPRTSRSIGPRLTVSGHSVDISTPGAAGFRLAQPDCDPEADPATTRIKTMSRMTFFFRASLRGMSM